MRIAEPRLAISSEADAHAAIRSACALIPPLYSLDNFVAVNPFLGWSSTPLAEASVRIAEGLDAEVLPKFEYYRRAWEAGKIQTEGLCVAAARHGLSPEVLETALTTKEAVGMASRPAVQLESERASAELGLDLPKFLRRFISRNLADICSAGLGSDGILVNPSRLYEELVSRAAIDKTFELLGISGWRRWMGSAPSEYSEAIRWVSSKRRRESSGWEAYAYRLLGSQYGWASYLRGMGWNSASDELALVEALCAALLLFDLAVAELLPGKAHKNFAVALAPVGVNLGGLGHENDLVRVCLQDAYEDRLVRTQLASFIEPKPELGCSRPIFQIMFCIDVRSEVLRRSLERLSSRVETVGFAGFFGVATSLVDEGDLSPRCPVLISPQIEIKASGAGVSRELDSALRMSFSSPGAFNLVETFGVGFIGSILLRATGLVRKERDDESSLAASGYSSNHFGLTLAERVGLAETILVNSGIGKRLGRIVVLCGHGGRSSNNAHEASLDCGACGGHCGALNAQMAVQLLNDVQVQAELGQRGFVGIEGVLFLAAQHDTSTDEVTLFRTHDLSEEEGRLVEELQGLFGAASADCRTERARFMGVEGKSGRKLFEALDRRANDWSEVRPEWGLARNSLFVAARRFRTRGADFEGRAFLHDYDESVE